MKKASFIMLLVVTSLYLSNFLHAQEETQEEYFYEQKYKVTTFDVEPLQILIQGNFAIVHLNFELSYKDPEGKEITESGPWAAVLIKQDGKWFYLSNIWTVK